MRRRPLKGAGASSLLPRVRSGPLVGDSRFIVSGPRIDPARQTRTVELRRAPTPAESVLGSYLQGNQLDGFHFRRQRIIDGFIVDLYCHRARLVVNADGPIHVRRVVVHAERTEA